MFFSNYMQQSRVLFLLLYIFFLWKRTTFKKIKYKGALNCSYLMVPLAGYAFPNSWHGFNFGDFIARIWSHHNHFFNQILWWSQAKMSSRSSRTVYVGNLPGDIREREVEDLFYKVTRCRLILALYVMPVDTQLRCLSFKVYFFAWIVALVMFYITPGSKYELGIVFWWNIR